METIYKFGARSSNSLTTGSSRKIMTSVCLNVFKKAGLFLDQYLQNPEFPVWL
jgi:hypothetical protein